MPENAGKYNCIKCHFRCSKKSNYDKHILTRKHKSLTDTDADWCDSIIYSCECGKEYKHNSSLWNHKQKCNYVDVKPNTVVDINMQSIDPTTVVTLLKENIELKKIMIKQNIEIHQNL